MILFSEAKCGQQDRPEWQVVKYYLNCLSVKHASKWLVVHSQLMITAQVNHLHWYCCCIWCWALPLPYYGRSWLPAAVTANAPCKRGVSRTPPLPTPLANEAPPQMLLTAPNAAVLSCCNRDDGPLSWLEEPKDDWCGAKKQPRCCGLLSSTAESCW